MVDDNEEKELNPEAVDAVLDIEVEWKDDDEEGDKMFGDEVEE